MEGYISHIQLAIIRAVKGVLPVLKTFLKNALFAISGLPTAEIALKAAKYKYSRRL
jgi:hypothetical protein